MPDMHLVDLSHVFYVRGRGPVPKVGHHLHNGCEIYIFMDGDVQYFVDHQLYAPEPWDVLVTHNREVHCPMFLSERTYERAFIQFSDAALCQLDPSLRALTAMITDRPAGTDNLIRTNPVQKKQLAVITGRLDQLLPREDLTANALRWASLLEILAVLHEARSGGAGFTEVLHVSPKIQPVIEYILENLTGDLSLELLSGRFFISPAWLSRQFHKETGIPLHDFIVAKRMVVARDLLAQGLSVREACIGSGFSNYAHFIRAFTRLNGVSPGQYQKQFQRE